MSKHNGNHRANDIQPEQITAHALGQLHGEELAAVKAALGESGGSSAGDKIRKVQTLAAAITAARNAEPLPKPSGELRAAIESRLDQLAAGESPTPAVELPAERRPWNRQWNRQWTVALVAAGGLCCVLVALLLPAVQASRKAAQVAQTSNNLKELNSDSRIVQSHRASTISPEQYSWTDRTEASSRVSNGIPAPASSTPSDTTVGDLAFMVKPRVIAIQDDPPSSDAGSQSSVVTDPTRLSTAIGSGGAGKYPGAAAYADVGGNQGQPVANNGAGAAGPGYGTAIADGGLQAGGSAQGAGMPGTGMARFFNDPRGLGGYPGGSPGYYPGGYPGSASGSGNSGASIANNPLPGTPSKAYTEWTELKPNGESQRPASATEARKFRDHYEREVAEHTVRVGNTWEYDGYVRDEGRRFGYGDGGYGGEQYEPIVENAFLSPLSPYEARSTFSIDVDTASYANVRRFLNEGRLPPPSAVRIEELVNYFNYSYPQPTGREPFSVNMEAAECPWNAGHLLLRVGLKGKEVHRSERPPSNLTFLLDVSGSMSDANKLPLLKTTLMMFVAELTENDRVSIVTYAGDAGLRLPPTRGNEKEKIMAAIDSLSAGGSTHGSAGIQLAYEQAGQYFLKDGTNRVLLATDGDLNVGVTSDDALVELIKEKAAGGTFLTVLGFGTGNLKDGKLEKLADNGNGVYAYIDGVREGRKVLVEQMSGSLVTIAKDVKIQIEFNPAQIASYRLLGYENRVLAAEDFNNDKKDAGEIGAGHTVTALYELVPVGTKEVAAAPQVGEPLKYQATGAVGNALRGVPETGGQRSEVRGQVDARLTEAAASGELLTLKLRYKDPDGVESRLVEFPLKERGGPFHSASKDLQFAAAVASFGMILRGSEHRGTGNLPAVAEIASGALGDDANGYRAEFVDLVRKAQSLGAR